MAAPPTRSDGSRQLPPIPGVAFHARPSLGLEPPSSAVRPGRPPPTSAGEEFCRRADALALALRASLDRIGLTTARAARAFTERKAWIPFGYARMEDHARERFGRSGRWLRHQAALGRALDSLPTLAEAFTGDDGRRPIGKVAALTIGRVATPESVRAWIELARAVSVRELREAARAARAAGSAWPPMEDEQSDHGVGQEERSLIRFPVLAPVQAAFDEAAELHRAVEGHEASLTSFVEALVAEASAAGDLPPDTDRVPLRPGKLRSVVETAMARATGLWRHLPGAADLERTGTALDRLEELARFAGQGEPPELDVQLRELLELEDDLGRRLGDLLARMSETGAWSRLMFAGVGHYSEQRLGISRTSGEDLARLARALRRFPVLRDAYEQGRVGLESARLVVRILGRGPVDESVERAWAVRAEEATIKRLRDEARALGRVRSSGACVSDSMPLDDSPWHASLRRAPGMARERIFRFGTQAAEMAEKGCFPDVFLRLRLPDELAADLLAAVESVRQRLTRCVEQVAWDEPWPRPDAAPSVRAARTFSVRCRRVPAWVGLLALVEEYVEVWDDPRQVPRRHGDAVYIRDGWRCTAPGCTSRRNLEDHHLVYRSRAGGDELSNRTCLCRFHHQQGEHGELASCRGKAPLGLLWKLGRAGMAGVFRNERRIRD